MRCQQCLARRNTIRADENWATGTLTQKQRFIANDAGGTIGSNFKFTGKRTSVATADNARDIAVPAQGIDEVQSKRSFSGSPNGNATDNHDRDRQALRHDA